MTLEETLLSITFFAVAFAMVSVINSLRYRSKKIIVMEYDLDVPITEKELTEHLKEVKHVTGLNVIGFFGNKNDVRSI